MLIARISLPKNIVNNIKTRIILIIAKIGKKKTTRLQDYRTTRLQAFFDTRNSEPQNLRRTLAVEL